MLYSLLWYLPGVWTAYKWTDVEEVRVSTVLIWLLAGLFGWFLLFMYLNDKYNFLDWELWRRK
jgi:hypothetical protein